MEKVNITVIGAGIIGLSIAEKLSKTHNKILLLEKHASFGQETSSRNSEVIHSGIYYKKGSLKAIPGNVPSVRTFPSGCRYHPRCSEVEAVCQVQKPSNIHLDNGINVACLKYSSYLRGSP